MLVSDPKLSPATPKRRCDRCVQCQPTGSAVQRAGGGSASMSVVLLAVGRQAQLERGAARAGGLRWRVS